MRCELVVKFSRRMAAVVQCANACSLRTGWTPSGVSSSGSGSDGVQSWRGRGFGGARFRKVGGERRGVVSMALAHGEEVEGAAGGVFRLAQKTVVALALGLSLSIGGQFSFPGCLTRSPLPSK